MEVHLVHRNSDHCPLLIKLVVASNSSVNGEKPQRFEDYWISKKGCRDAVEDF